MSTTFGISIDLGNPQTCSARPVPVRICELYPKTNRKPLAALLSEIAVRLRHDHMVPAISMRNARALNGGKWPTYEQLGLSPGWWLSLDLVKDRFVLTYADYGCDRTVWPRINPKQRARKAKTTGA